MGGLEGSFRGIFLRPNLGKLFDGLPVLGGGTYACKYRLCLNPWKQSVGIANEIGTARRSGPDRRWVYRILEC
eukprot:scaffold3274_cov244-Pinguiococcus_pyrenoidosus.AAC.7